MIYPYRFDDQFEKYIGQFMRVFSGFQTRDGVDRDGENKLRRIPIVYGNMSRITATILNKRDSFNANMIPMMAANLSGIQIDNERKKPASHLDAFVYKDEEGHKSLERTIGPPFIMDMELSIYASSLTEMFGLLEQILLIFNPRISIQVDNKSENSDYITEISLDNIQPEFQYPMGHNKEVIMITLNFSVPVRLRYPYNPEGSVIEDIITNIVELTRSGLKIPTESVVITGEVDTNIDDMIDKENKEDEGEDNG